MMIEMKTTWEEVIGRSSDMSWPTLGRDDGDMLQSIVMIIIDFECDSLDDDDDLTQEKASLRKSGGHSGQSAEKALYSTPKF